MSLFCSKYPTQYKLQIPYSDHQPAVILFRSLFWFSHLLSDVLTSFSSRHYFAPGTGTSLSCSESEHSLFPLLGLLSLFPWTTPSPSHRHFPYHPFSNGNSIPSCTESPLNTNEFQESLLDILFTQSITDCNYKLYRTGIFNCFVPCSYPGI